MTILQGRDTSGRITYKEKVMVFGLCAEIFEDTLLPIALHLIPVLDHAVTDRIVDSVRLVVGNGFISDKEI